MFGDQNASPHNFRWNKRCVPAILRKLLSRSLKQREHGEVLCDPMVCILGRISNFSFYNPTSVDIERG